MSRLSQRFARPRHRIAGLAVVTAAALAVAAAAPGFAEGADHASGSAATPIKHLVVIFQENVSFDHYFGTYPNAANTDGTPVPRRAGHAER